MVNKSEPSIVDNFKRYFSVEIAKNKEQKLLAYAMRYRVYCLEFNYEPPNPEELESDQFDDRSEHCLIIHRHSNSPAGCVRLVPTYDSREKDALPFEKHCLDSLDDNFINQLALNRQEVCEISRLAVDGIFRRRQGEKSTRFGEQSAFDFSQQEQRTFSLIAVACFLSATVLTETTGRTNVFAMMEPFLPRLMNRSGIMFQRAGQDIDYHGIRAPYFITTRSALTHMHPDLRELYQWIKTSIVTA